MAKGRRLTANDIKRIAVEYGRCKTAGKLAKEMNVKKETIYRIVWTLRKAGLSLPKRYESNMSRAIAELKEERIDLFGEEENENGDS